MLMAGNFFQRQFRRAPGKRDAAATMTVVVHDGFVRNLLRFQGETAWAKRTQANDVTDDSIRRDLDRRECRRQTCAGPRRMRAGRKMMPVRRASTPPTAIPKIRNGKSTSQTNG